MSCFLGSFLSNLYGCTVYNVQNKNNVGSLDILTIFTLNFQQTFRRNKFWFSHHYIHIQSFTYWVYLYVSNFSYLLSRLVYSSGIQMLNAIPCVYQQDTYIRSNNVLNLTSYVTLQQRCHIFSFYPLCDRTKYSFISEYEYYIVIIALLIFMYYYCVLLLYVHVKWILNEFIIIMSENMSHVRFSFILKNFIISERFFYNL